VVASARWPALGSTAGVFVTNASAIASARALLDAELERIDRACSRFRPDSELSRLNAVEGRPVQASPLFLEAVEAGLHAAHLTGGAVDPTVGRAIRAIGYDRDFRALRREGPPATRAPVAGWRVVQLNRRAGTVRLPPGVELDLGATAKALAADRAAAEIFRTLRCGVLVDLGGDISVAGPAPPGGWSIGISDDHRDEGSNPDEAVSISSGGLATSSTTVRRWIAGREPCHHIVDPRTGTSARVVWRSASVAAGSCLHANTASTAAIVRGGAAPAWLGGLRLPSRLVRADGQIVRLCGWRREAVA
jgi:thiamine biosynthesis lipoprotein